MNNTVKAQAVNVFEKHIAVLGKGVSWDPDDLLSLVAKDDREKLIPYIEGEISAAESMGKAGAEYVYELQHLKALIEKEA